MSFKIADKHAHGDRIQAQFTITIWDDGSLSINGPINDKIYTLAVLENAKDAVRNHRNPDMVDLIIPGSDVSLEKSIGKI
jgi:hypothetical protein